MKGSGWRLRVWQNLGWHYSVYRGPLQVYVHQSPTSRQQLFSCLMADHPEASGSGGALIWYEQGVRSRDPNAAVRRQLDFARGAILQLAAAYNAAGAGIR